jgi:hypothetical protein
VLAYDLYLKNKNYAHEFVKPELIKKIFVDKDYKTGETVVNVDDTSLSEYGISESNKGTFQRIFQMPEKNKAKLPYRSTGSNSPKPYLEIKGEFKNKENMLEFFLCFPDKKNPKFSSVLILNIDKDTNELKGSKERTHAENSGVKVKLNKNDYRIDDLLSVYDLYVNLGIISNDILASEIFENVSKEYFNFVKSKWISDLSNKKEKGLNFSLIILPSKKNVVYRSTNANTQELTGGKTTTTIDSFGNETSGFPVETTQTAKFLSFDDPSFALNCKEKAEFYENLAIGINSLKSVNIADDEVFKIAGLSWLFTDLDDPTFKFRYTKKGIYHQLLSNYNDLKRKSGDSYKQQAFMKIICFEKNQAKLEILLDENLTMSSMRKMFSMFDGEHPQKNIPDSALEILIEKIQKSSGTKIVWSIYLDAVQSLIRGKTMNRGLILSFFTKQIKSKLFECLPNIKNKSETMAFFERSEFCMKILTISDHLTKTMNENEEYAYKMGLIAGRYVNFKKFAKEESNSLKDILTYSKYDREKLRFVLHRIGLGVNLSDSNQNNMNNMLSFIKNNYPSIEITDDDANKDFSYFFYKGVFQELC